MNGDPPSGSGAPRPAGEPGEGSGPARPRRPGSEPLALGVTALFVGLLATVASAINSRTSGRAYVPQAMWIALVAIGALAGAGAVLAWLTGPQRLRPSPVIGAVIGAVALIGGPLEAVAVRPHAVRARVVAVDPATGRLVWTARPPLTNLSAPVAVAPDGTLVVAGQATASTCDGRSAQVHLDAATGSQRGATTFGAFRPTGLSVATSTDGTTTYEYTAGGAGAVVRATRGGTTLWAHPAGYCPPPTLSVGPGVVLVDAGPAGPYGAVAPPVLLPTTAPLAPTGDVVVKLGLDVVDSATGQTLWTDTTGAVGAAAGGAVWTLSADGALNRRDPRTGVTVDHHQAGFTPSPTAFGAGPVLWSVADRLVTLDAPDDLVGLDTNAGVVWHRRVPGAATAALTVVAAGDRLIASVDGRLGRGCGGE